MVGVGRHAVIAVTLKLGYLVSPSLEVGAFVVSRLFASVGTYPLLFAIGASLPPSDRPVAAILTGASRRALTSFAQIATWNGGAITVTLALILLTRFT